MNDSGYTRILLKLSGESLGGNAGQGFDPDVLRKISSDLKELVELGVAIGVVVGGGNFFRGLASGLPGCDRVDADRIGMLATVMNGLALKAALCDQQLKAEVYSSFAIAGVVEQFNRATCLEFLRAGGVAILTGGTGNPLFTTDSAASLRAVEINAQILIKATRVDGVYDSDPEKNPSAKRFSSLSFAQVLERKLAVMDTTAIVLCQENQLPIRVLDLGREDSLKNAVLGLDEGTLIS
ncbi:MAG: uridylate kinase [Parasphingorhabdus sp.]